MIHDQDGTMHYNKIDSITSLALYGRYLKVKQWLLKHKHCGILTENLGTNIVTD